MRFLAETFSLALAHLGSVDQNCYPHVLVEGTEHSKGPEQVNQTRKHEQGVEAWQQTEIGGELNVTNSLVAVDKGFLVASSSAPPVGTSCGSPTIFGEGTVANTGITQQDLVYDVQVNETLTTSTNTCYKATLVVTPNGSSATIYGPVYMNSTVSILSTFGIDCEFDIGARAPSSPYSFQLTVQ